MNVAKLLVDLQRALAADDALGIKMILGFPNMGRMAPTFPLGAVVFGEAAYGVGANGVTRARIGQHQPIGVSIIATLYLFAEDEYGLLGLVDQLVRVRGQMAQVDSEGVRYWLHIDPIRRSDLSMPAPDETMLDYIVECRVVMTNYQSGIPA